MLTRTQLMALARDPSGARGRRASTTRTSPAPRRCWPSSRRRCRSPVAVAHSEREACEGADIIIPSTLAVTPTIDKEWVPAGGLVVLVSSLDGPEDLHTVTDLLVVDDRDHEGTADTRYLRRLRDAGIAAAERRGRPGGGRLRAAPGPHRGRSSASSARPWASAWTTS